MSRHQRQRCTWKKVDSSQVEAWELELGCIAYVPDYQSLVHTPVDLEAAWNLGYSGNAIHYTTTPLEIVALMEAASDCADRKDELDTCRIEALNALYGGDAEIAMEWYFKEYEEDQELIFPMLRG